ncbi:MAG: hypothetical protein ACE5JD_12370 [Candidatus Methylomirabilia bacterium]
MRLTGVAVPFLATALVWLGAASGLAAAQESLTRTSRQGPVTVTVTLIPPVEASRPLRVRVALDTHSVALDDIGLDAAVALRQPGGDIAPTAVEQAQGGGHHRRAVVVFPPQPVGDRIELVVTNVGGVVERSFRWELPLKP